MGHSRNSENCRYIRTERGNSFLRRNEKKNIQELSCMPQVDAIPRQWRALLKLEMYCPSRKHREQNEWFKYTLNIGGMDIRTDKITNKLV